MANAEVDIFPVEKVQADSNLPDCWGQSKSLSANTLVTRGIPKLGRPGTGFALTRPVCLISLIWGGLALRGLSRKDDRRHIQLADHLVIGGYVSTQNLLPFR